MVRLEADDWLEVLVNTYLASDLTQQQKVALLMPRIQGTDAIQLLPPERQRLFMRLLGQASGVQLSKEAREVLGARMGLVVPVPDPASTALAAATPTAAGAGSGLSG